MNRIILFFLMLFLVGSSNGFATLINRGNGLIYDKDQNITWLQNANLGANETFGISEIQADGQMSWNVANEWINAMNNNNYLGFNDWRLPLTPIEGGTSFSYDGSTSYGFNITNSEMGYMYYENLNNLGYYALDGTNPQPGWGLNNSYPFNNLQANEYWSGTEHIPSDGAFKFYFNKGLQTIDGNKDGKHFAWAVRDGDVGAPVPEPATMLLLGTGLIGLAGGARRRRKK